MNLNKNIKFVNNTYATISRDFQSVLESAYDNKFLCDDWNDILTINFVQGLNPDGSDRMIINWA